MLLLVAWIYFSLEFRSRANQEYLVNVREIPISYSSEALESGAHLSVVKGCRDCHGEDLGGKIMFDDPAVGLLVAPNLTNGKGGLPNDYSETDFIKALRHGLGRNNKSLLIMPSHETSRLSDEDVAAVVAYCRKTAPVDRELPKTEFSFFGKALTSFGLIPAFSAEPIDHNLVQPKEIKKGISIQYGQYVAVSCSGCHKPDFKGGPSPVPGQPPIPNISSSGNTGKWTLTEFTTVLKTGKLPDGRQLKNEEMPWKMTSHYTEEEIQSLYLFLKSI